MTGQPAGSWRISDADRLAAVEALGEHYAAGRLDKAEYDERSDAVMAARTPEQLHPVFADLPLPHGRVVDQVVTQQVAPVPTDRAPARRHHHSHVPWPALLLVVPLVVVVAHAPFLLLVPLVWFVLLRRAGWSPRRRTFR